MKTIKEVAYRILGEIQAWLDLAYENVRSLGD